MKINNEKLLSTIIEDSKSSPAVYMPTSYWQGYCDRITKRIEQVGISSFRSDYKLTKGYITSGVNELNIHGIEKGTRADFLRRLLMKVPFVAQLINHYEDHAKDLSRRSHQLFCSYYRSIIHFSKNDYSSIEDCMFADPVKLSLNKNITPTLIYAINNPITDRGI